MSDNSPPTKAFELPPELIGPRDLADQDTAPNRCQHPGCTNSVVRTGRGGRPPKYCPEHRDNRAATPTPNNRSATSGKSWPRATEVESILTSYIGYLGYGIRLVNPDDGKVIAEGGPAVVHELVELAKTDTKLRKPLELLAAPGKYTPLTLALGAVIIPIMVNHNLLPQFEIPGLTSKPDLRVVRGGDIG